MWLYLLFFLLGIVVWQGVCFILCITGYIDKDKGQYISSGILTLVCWGIGAIYEPLRLLYLKKNYKTFKFYDNSNEKNLWVGTYFIKRSQIHKFNTTGDYFIKENDSKVDYHWCQKRYRFTSNHIANDFLMFRQNSIDNFLKDEYKGMYLKK